jgi:hypothetical protein
MLYLFGYTVGLGLMHPEAASSGPGPRPLRDFEVKGAEKSFCCCPESAAATRFSSLTLQRLPALSTYHSVAYSALVFLT